MLRAGENLQGRAGLHDTSCLHNDESVSALGSQTEIMSNKHHGRAEFASELVEVVEDFLRHGHVESGRGLIGNQQLWVRGQAHRDKCALAHTTGELVRVLVDTLFSVRQAGLFQQLNRLFVGLRTSGDVIGAQRLLNLGTDGPHRIEIGHRVLRNQADAVAADANKLAVRQVCDVTAIEGDGATGDFTITGQQPQRGVDSGGLTRAGLADNGDRLTGENLQVDVMHHIGQRFTAAAGRCGRRKANADILQGENGRCGSIGVGAHRRRSFGSRESFKASPMRMKPRTVIARASAGQNRLDGAWRSTCCATEMSLPQETVVVGRPMPR